MQFMLSKLTSRGIFWVPSSDKLSRFRIWVLQGISKIRNSDRYQPKMPIKRPEKNKSVHLYAKVRFSICLNVYHEVHLPRLSLHNQKNRLFITALLSGLCHLCFSEGISTASGDMRNCYFTACHWIDKLMHESISGDDYDCLICVRIYCGKVLLAVPSVGGANDVKSVICVREEWLHCLEVFLGVWTSVRI